MLRSSRLVFPLVCALFLQGCFSTIVRASGPAGTRHSEAGASLLWGITTPTHGATQCTNGLREVEMYRPWYSHLVAIITLGIVTPITVQWECLGATAAVVPAYQAAPVSPPQ